MIKIKLTNEEADYFQALIHIKVDEKEEDDFNKKEKKIIESVMNKIINEQEKEKENADL